MEWNHSQPYPWAGYVRNKHCFLGVFENSDHLLATKAKLKDKILKKSSISLTLQSRIYVMIKYCVSLARLWCSAAWSNSILDIVRVI